MNKKIAIIIPAYNPDEKLIELINKIMNEITKKIIVINDGSKSNKIFEKIGKSSIILNNKRNKGKGYSLKRGLTQILEREKEIIAIITVDADGQHEIKDIKNIARRLEENNKNSDEKIVLGSRDFSKENVPIKNKLGNKISSILLKRKTGTEIRDTQTGLRGIPFRYINEIVELKGNRYEYEQNMLKYIVKKRIPYEEINISTIYNKSKSNFNIIIDSYKIVKAIIYK